MSDTRYRIMVVAAKKDANKSLYKYLLQGDHIYEAVTLDEIDAKIEKMLNIEGYAKSDFIVVNELEFNVFANVINNTELRDNAVVNPEEPPASGDDTGNNSGTGGSTDSGNDNGESGNGSDPSDPDDGDDGEGSGDPVDPNPDLTDPEPTDPDPADPSNPEGTDPEPDPDPADPDNTNP